MYDQKKTERLIKIVKLGYHHWILYECKELLELIRDPKVNINYDLKTGKISLLKFCCVYDGESDVASELITRPDFDLNHYQDHDNEYPLELILKANNNETARLFFSRPEINTDGIDDLIFKFVDKGRTESGAGSGSHK